MQRLIGRAPRDTGPSTARIGGKGQFYESSRSLFQGLVAQQVRCDEACPFGL